MDIYQKFEAMMSDHAVTAERLAVALSNYMSSTTLEDFLYSEFSEEIACYNDEEDNDE